MESIKRKPLLKSKMKKKVFKSQKEQIEYDLNLKEYNDIDLLFKQIKDSIKLT